MTNLDNEPLIDRWRQVCKKIDAAKQKIQTKDEVRLLAVSKTKPAQMVAALIEQGQLDFGENYLQEAVDKMAAVNELLTANDEAQPETNRNNQSKIETVNWHYIGHIQRNKTRDIAAHFDWVHTIEREIIAKRLNEQRPDTLPKLNVLIQVNIDHEESKSGCLPDDVDTLIDTIKGYDKLCLRGLMIIPSKLGAGVNASAFQRTKKLFDAMAVKHSELTQWDTLSMGMSADLQEAIEYGSTLVRVGSAIFGERD